MSGTARASGAASKVTVAAYAVLSAAPLLVGVAVCVLDVKPGHALPSYARQTGQQCAACHNGFPELTPYGRLFKLNGYTFSSGQSDLPPLAAMLIPAFTHTQADQPGANSHFGPNNNFTLQTASLFYGGAIAPNVGA